MNKNTHTRIASLLLAGAVAVVPLVGMVALAPSAAAIADVDGNDVVIDPGHEELGIRPAIANLDEDDIDPATDPTDTGIIECRDDYGNTVDCLVPSEDDIDRSDLTRTEEIVPISANLPDGGLPAGAWVAIIGGSVVVLAAGTVFGLKNRANQA